MTTNLQTQLDAKDKIIENLITSLRLQAETIKIQSELLNTYKSKKGNETS